MTTLASYLTERSREICRANECTEDEHNCECYAYVTSDGMLLDICCPGYFQGTSKPHAAICLPWSGTQEELAHEIAEQTWDQCLPQDSEESDND